MFEESESLKEIAIQLIKKQERVAHVEADNVLFLVNFGDKPNAAARCYSLSSHPIQFFTDKEFCIVVYNENTDYMSDEQMAILVMHELMHIPLIGTKLIEHNVKDFKQILEVDLNWCKPGVAVPDILL